METAYTSKTDAIDQYIKPALGDFADDYDIDGIFDEAFEWVDGKLQMTAGDFYEVAARHDIGEK